MTPPSAKDMDMNQKLIKKCRAMLLSSVSHPEPLVRAEGARLLGELRDSRAVPGLIAMLKSDRWYSKITAIYALGDIRDKHSLPVLRDMAADPRVFDFPGMYNHDMIRIAAAMTLLKFNDNSGLQKISDVLRIKNLQAYLELAVPILSLPNNARNRPLKARVDRELLQRFARDFRGSAHVRIARALPFFKTPESRRMLVKYLGHFSRYVRAAAAEELGPQKHKGLLVKLWRKERTPFTRIKLAQLLGRPEQIKVIAGYLHNPDFFVRATALDALAAVKGREWIEKIVPLLDDEHFYVRLCAVEALEKLRCKAAGQKIEQLLKDENLRVRMQAAKYFVVLSNQDVGR
jgi:HEAT repeat protein